MSCGSICRDRKAELDAEAGASCRGRRELAPASLLLLANVDRVSAADPLFAVPPALMPARAVVAWKRVHRKS